MIILGNAIVSEELLERKFACQLHQCKGACCVEGDQGAPLEENEIEAIELNMPEVLPLLNEASVEWLKNNSFYTRDEEGDLVTACHPTGECVFANYQEDGILYCALEKAHQLGKSTFKKPISCHLYPIRTKQYGEYIALNYHHWNICNAACKAGEEQKIPVHQFLKDAIIRKMGENWYEELDAYYHHTKP